LNFRVFKYNVFTLSTIIGCVINMALFAAMVLLPVYLQNLRGFTPLDAGLLLLPGAIVMAIMSPISGWIFDRIGARMLAIVGLVITVVTTWEFSKLTMDTPYSHILVLYIFRMFGMSMLGMPIMTEGLNALPRHLYSHGTAMANTLRQVAASLGTAFLVTVMSNRSKFHAENYRNEMTENNLFFMDIVAQLKHAIPSDEAVTQLLYGIIQQHSAVEGINDAFFVATGLAVLALLLSFFLKGKKKNAPSA
jgi:EmrB/QacA subfamily drug resistance transporter